ncbi:MAG: alginate export family protein [Candidatus Omnitrophica bacterium]|nr:alginate export family protein [Candidatus Omnitrophota bacterium]
MKKYLFSILFLFILSSGALAAGGSFSSDLGKISFYGQERLRWYLWDYFESEPFDNRYDHFASQLRLGSRLDNPILKAHVAWQYATVWNLPAGASAGAGSGALYFSNGTAEADTHGTYLKYLEVQSKEIAGTGLSVGGGRMNYSSGNQYAAESGKIQWLKSNRIAERLIGGFGWSEYQRSFDGGYAGWDGKKLNLQITGMNPTQGGFDENAKHTLYDIDLLASELTIKKGALFPDAELQLFYYGYADSREMTAATSRRDNTGRTVPAGVEYDIDVRMIGGHLAGAAELGGGTVDYLVWGGYQYGDWFELDHTAYALVTEAGYQWKNVPWTPWIRGGYNLGSGDSDLEDGDHGTFYQMLPTGRQYSFSILYNMMNTQDAFVSLILKPSDSLSVRSEVHWVDLSESADHWYVGSGEITDGSAVGYSVRSGSGEDNLGTLLDVGVSYKICPQAALYVYYGHFFGSDVVERFYNKKRDSDFFYTELTINF